LYAAAQRVGYGELLWKLIRIRLKYPLGCPDVDELISKIMMLRYDEILFADLFDRRCVTVRK
jgi:hypothetical protein